MDLAGENVTMNGVANIVKKMASDVLLLSIKPLELRLNRL